MNARTSVEVRDVMRRGVPAVDSQATYKQIVKAMVRGRLRAVPVVDARGVVLGIVSETDLGEQHRHLPRVIDSGRRRHPLSHKRAFELMTAPAISVRPDTTAKAAALRAYDHDVRQLPVIDDGGILLGLVHRLDLLSMYLLDDQDIEVDIEHKVIHDQFSLEPGSVTATVADGIVLLRGQLESGEMEDFFVQAVRHVPGVIGIDNELTQRAGSAGQAAPTIPPAPFDAGIFY